jgi:hypothetical protein
MCSKSYADFIQRDRKTRQLRNVFMVLAVGLQFSFLGVLYRRYFLEIVDTEWDSPFLVINFVSELIKTFMDFYALWIIVSYFIFIVRRRLALFRHKSGKVPFRSACLIGWISLILGLIALEMVFIHLLSVVIPGSSGGDDGTPLMVEAILYQRFVAYPLLDFIQATTITYIFYRQARETLIVG